ncbi:L-alanine-DL-glutamate epimerase-like enolase superfamily enzyme [Cellulosimicrobium cellulans]|uniref:enolase C-terminal domain-like protein n=1 Tax=Cellulosimicrobium cellulans TaxID=1710 RepID=UPI0027DB994C|nr:enolase C-terminal domain-like protein [Cellulosimicrobium cellulans]MBM7818762.1 L-alanine-DL-glutamate epimerase-like enolase superfamily enzyme [Cellulosimicrobium cellulans]
MSVGPAARVVAVRTATTVVPLPQPLRLGAMTVERREYVGVRVVAETDDGRTVAGESYALTREAPMAELVDRLVAPHVVGREVVASDGVAARQSVGAAWEAALRGSAIVGRVGLVRRAIGLVDVALWDLAGRLAGRPVWSLLDDGADPAGSPHPGAAEHGDVPPGAVAAPRPAILVAAYPTPGRTARDVADEVLAHARAGWPLLKISRSPDRVLMRDLLAILRAELPEVTGRPTVAGRSGVVVDVGFGWRDADEALADLDAWGVTGAVGQSGEVEPALAWLEDPLLPEDAVGAARVRDASGLPLSVGDEVTDPEVFAHLAMLGALDVPRVDVVAIGGITVADPLVRAWAARGMVVSSHVYPEVSVHLGGAAGIGVETFDRSPAGNPYDPAPLLVRGGPAFDGGHATPPDAPGLGFTLDPDRFDLEEPS